MAKAPAPKNGQLLYKLEGVSLSAAKRLEQEIEKELETTSPLRLGNVSDINKSWCAFYTRLLARLEKEAPEVLEHTGLHAGTTCVREKAQHFPRAYKKFPDIFLSPLNPPDYYMYVPTDYKGRHFVPADARLLDKKEEERVGNLLFAGGWLGNAPLVSTPENGIKTPEDFIPQTVFEPEEWNQNDLVCFLAKGRSLDIIHDLEARTAVWQKKLDAARAAIKQEVKKTLPQLLASLPPGEEVNINASYSYRSGEVPQLTLSIQLRGTQNIFAAGQTIPPLPSPAFHLVPRGYGEYIVTARTDTPEGVAFAKWVDDIPSTPWLGDCPELFAPFKIKEDSLTTMLGLNGTVPRTATHAENVFLIYNASAETPRESFCPTDAIPCPAEIYYWLQDDEADRNLGNTPPPMPKEVAEFLSAHGKKSAPGPKPKTPRL